MAAAGVGLLLWSPAWAPEQWHDETPCSEWDVRALIHHVFDEQLWTGPLFEGLTIGEVGDRFEGDLMGDDASTWEGLVASSIDEAHGKCAAQRSAEDGAPVLR